MSINFVVNCHFTKIALLGLTHFLGTVSNLSDLSGEVPFGEALISRDPLSYGR